MNILKVCFLLVLGGCATGTADVAAAIEKVKLLDDLDERNDNTVVIAQDREIRRLASVVLDYETLEELRQFSGAHQGMVPVDALHAAFKALQKQRDQIMAQYNAKLDEFMARPERDRKRKLLDATATYIGALDEINQQVQALVGQETP